jgi:F-type H+-transporting ATPase subunit epsilon
MATLTRLSIVTPSAVTFEGDAELVVAPGAAGDLGALANHAPMLTTLRTGVVKANVVGEGSDGKSQARRVEFAVEGGFMEILADRVIILTDLALSRDEVDVEAARADLKRAEEALAQKRGGDDAQERRAVAWAHARLEVSARPVV